MIDLHTHTLLSDGVLVPAELAQRARVAGYRAVAITDHVDISNLESTVRSITRFTDAFNSTSSEFKVIPGVELTHLSPELIGEMTDKARSLGARLVVCHGETLAEPVQAGTNRAAIEAGVDILAHPGLITEGEARLAAEQGVYLEISSRGGHSLTNGHVAATSEKTGASLILNTDAHAPADLIDSDMAERVLRGAGLTQEQIAETKKNAEVVLEKFLS